MNWAELGDILLRLGTAVVLGGSLGFERHFHGRWTGMRTHMIVAVASGMFVIAALKVSDDNVADATRVIQGIAAGVGFLGAGTILKLSDQLEVKGLTTAASVWLAAAVGTTAGLAFYELAIGGSILSLVVLAVLRPLEKRLDSPSDDTPSDGALKPPTDVAPPREPR